MYELPGEIRAHIAKATGAARAHTGRSIEASKRILGDGINEMWTDYVHSLPHGTAQKPYHPKAAELLRICDYLDAVRTFLPPESQRGVLSEHGLAEVRCCVEDFSGADPTDRRMTFFSGYREDPDYQGFDLYRRFLFPTPEAGGKYMDRRMNELAHARNLKRITLGDVDVFLDHGEREITVSRWTRWKLNRGYHYFVAGRVVTTEANPYRIAEEVFRKFDVIPETFVTTREHALF